MFSLNKKGGPREYANDRCNNHTDYTNNVFNLAEVHPCSPYTYLYFDIIQRDRHAALKRILFNQRKTIQYNIGILVQVSRPLWRSNPNLH